MAIMKTSSRMISRQTRPNERARCISVFAVTLLATSILLLASQSTASVLNRVELLGRDAQVRNRVEADSGSAIRLSFPKNVKKLLINVGPNTTPILPPADDPGIAILAVEPNIGIANYLREKLQKQRHVSRFFVINCAIAGAPLAGHISTFHHYNRAGMSSSLSEVRVDHRGRVPGFADRTRFDPTDNFGPGPAGMDFVPVLSLEALLSAVPPHIEIPLLKTDTQGFDFAVVKSASRKSLRRVKKIIAETYLTGIERTRYRNVQNDLERDWIPYMKEVGFELTNPTSRRNSEYDAIWIRKD